MTGKKQVGFGVLGCGVIGDFHASAMKETPAARLAAVADVDEARAKKVAEKFGCRWYGSLEELLQDPEVEVADICTPSGMHADQGMQAARAGKHVLLEKPMDRNLQKANRLIAYCKRRELKLGVIFQNRFNQDTRRIKRAIDEGRFGRLLFGSAETMWYRSQEYYDGSAWRGTFDLDGGALWNQGVHFVDLLCWMLGDMKKVLCAHLATTSRKMETEDIGVAEVLFRNGAIGIVRATTAVHPGLPSRLEICGTKGSAVFVNNRLTHYGAEGEEGLQPQETATGAGAAADPKAAGFTGHVGQIQDFAEAVLHDRPPFVDGIEGRRAVKLLTEIYRVAGMEKKRRR